VGLAQGDITHDKAEVMAKTICCVGWTSCQPAGVGKRWLSCWRKTWSGKWKEREQKSAKVLVLPGMEMGRKTKGEARVRLASQRKRKAAGVLVDVESLLHLATKACYQTRTKGVSVEGVWTGTGWRLLPQGPRAQSHCLLTSLKG
jgi:hypothetical protein